MYKPVKKWLAANGFEARAEVKGCDIVAVRDDMVLAVELKTTLNLEVILQAADRQRFSDIVYIAVPKKGRLMFTKRWRMICHLLRRLEIGLILVTVKGEEESAEEYIQPVPFDRVKSRQHSGRKRKAAVKEYQERHGDYNVGGSTRSKLVTVYREQSIVIAGFLAEHGSLSPKALRELGADSKKTSGILEHNHYGWFVRVSRGLYGITDEGRNALIKYHDVAAELKADYKVKVKENKPEEANHEKKRKRNNR